eukprot:1468-Prorocentrum_minimum.AAC.1
MPRSRNSMRKLTQCTFCMHARRWAGAGYADSDAQGDCERGGAATAPLSVTRDRRAGSPSAGGSPSCVDPKKRIICKWLTNAKAIRYEDRGVALFNGGCVNRLNPCC